MATICCKVLILLYLFLQSNIIITLTSSVKNKIIQETFSNNFKNSSSFSLNETLAKFNETEETLALELSSRSKIEYVPVTLEHPLFKVFGINPRDYVVYYRYRYDSSEEIDEPLPVHNLDKIAARMQELRNEIPQKNTVNLPNSLQNLVPIKKKVVFKTESEIRKRRKVENNSGGNFNKSSSDMVKIILLSKFCTSFLIKGCSPFSRKASSILINGNKCIGKYENNHELIYWFHNLLVIYSNCLPVLYFQNVFFPCFKLTQSSNFIYSHLQYLFPHYYLHSLQYSYHRGYFQLQIRKRSSQNTLILISILTINLFLFRISRYLRRGRLQHLGNCEPYALYSILYADFNKCCNCSSLQLAATKI